LGLGLVGTPNYIDGEDITHISYGQALGITVFILFYFRFTERFSRTIIFISIPWVIVGLIASAARGPILSCLGLLAICSVLMTPHTGILTKKAIRMALISTLVVAAIAVAALEQVPTFKQKFKAKEEQLTAFFEGAQDPGGSTENRLQLWSKAADAISQRPFLGWGVGGWVVFQTDENQGPYPHNMILESGVELGFVGIALLFNFYGNLIAGFRKLLKSNDRRFDFLVPLVIYIFLTSMVSGDMDNRLFWFWCGALFAACRIVAVNKLELVQPSQQPVLAYAG
jgi:O-antigen ligase